MSLDLSLWNIEAGLVQLMQMREEALDAVVMAEAEAGLEEQHERRAELCVIDTEIKKYIGAEIRKVDGIRAVWKTLQMLEINANAEAELQHQRALAYRRNLDRLKEACREVMESMPWREGKPKRIEGGTGSLLLKGNGGKQAVVISDERLVPDEFTLKTLTLTPHLLQDILNAIADHPDHQYGSLLLRRLATEAKESARVPSLSLIGEALQRNCQSCGGAGIIPIVDDNTEHGNCRACGGSGKQGVSGCFLAPRGQHVEIR